MRCLPRARWRGYIPWALILLALLSLVTFWEARSGRWRSGADETWLRCQRDGTLRVGMDASYPPFEVEQDGAFQGYDVDLAQEIGRRLGLQVVFVNTSFDGLYDALAAGRVDLLISALPYDGKVPDVLYTGGYFNAGQVVVARRDDSRIQEYQDLEGCDVAVEMGSMAHQEARHLRDSERLDLTIVTGQSSDEAFDLVEAGQADAAIADMVTARMALRDRPDLAIRGEPLTDESYVIAARSNSPTLYKEVNQALDDLRADGWLEELANRWL